MSEDYVMTKQKYEKLKLDLQHSKQTAKKLVDMELRNDLLQEKVAGLELEKAKEAKMEEEARQQRSRSLLGHLEATGEHGVVPVVVTLSFLEPKDVFKLVCVSKEVRRTFFLSNLLFDSFRDIFNSKLNESKADLESKQQQVQQLEKSLNFMQEQDSIRR